MKLASLFLYISSTSEAKNNNYEKSVIVEAKRVFGVVESIELKQFTLIEGHPTFASTPCIFPFQLFLSCFLTPPSVQIDLKFPLILFPFRLKRNSSLIGCRSILNNQRDFDFADGDLEEIDKRRDHRRSKAVEDMIFILSSPILCSRSRY